MGKLQTITSLKKNLTPALVTHSPTLHIWTHVTYPHPSTFYLLHTLEHPKTMCCCGRVKYSFEMGGVMWGQQLNLRQISNEPSVREHPSVWFGEDLVRVATVVLSKMVMATLCWMSVLQHTHCYKRSIFVPQIIHMLKY